jgi:hypothetical protein
MNDFNDPTLGDYLYSIVKGGLGALPFTGLLASDILGLIMASPFGKETAKVDDRSR